MSFVPINPRPMLQSLVDKEVIIRLKWGTTEYTGRLVSADAYMNVQLSGAEEWIGGKSQGILGQVLIRCNNVLWISARNQKLENGDADMQGLNYYEVTERDEKNVSRKRRPVTYKCE